MTHLNRKPVVKVCVHKDCCGRGSERVYSQLQKECSQEADIRKTYDCFRFCSSGPNVAVDGAVIHGVSEKNAVNRIREEIRCPSKKTEGIGTRSLDDLDSILDTLIL